jgi:hypothetical protein
MHTINTQKLIMNDTNKGPLQFTFVAVLRENLCEVASKQLAKCPSRETSHI